MRKDIKVMNISSSGMTLHKERVACSQSGENERKDPKVSCERDGEETA